MVINSVADAVKPGYYLPQIVASGGLTHEHRKYMQDTIGTIDDMISQAKHSAFMFLGDGEYLSNNLAKSLKRRQELDVTLVFGPYVLANSKQVSNNEFVLWFALIDDLKNDLNPERIKRYMRNTRTYDSNLVIVDNGASHTFPSSYSKTRVLESEVLDHRSQILAESVPIIKGSVEPVRLSDGDIEDFMESHPNLNELTRERIDEIVERERMKKGLIRHQTSTSPVLS